MDFFHNAKAVRLRSHHDKYLFAQEDEEGVVQDRNGLSRQARWVIEFVPGSDNFIRLKSCYGKYLTASNQPYLLGMTGRKVLQTLPRKLGCFIEWKPIRDGMKVKFQTWYGNFLRANGGLPPWRNSVTHDIPHRTSTQDWILWDIDVVEIEVWSPGQKPAVPPSLRFSDFNSVDEAKTSSSAHDVVKGLKMAKTIMEGSKGLVDITSMIINFCSN